MNNSVIPAKARAELDPVAGMHAQSKWVTQFVLVALLIGYDLFMAPALHANDDANTLEHIVVIWLKEPGNTTHRDKIISESEILKTIPGVVSLKSGSMLPGNRSIVDSSFDVALIVSLSDQAALQTYITHPTHTRLVEKTLQPLVREIRVYDIQ